MWFSGDRGIIGDGEMHARLLLQTLDLEQELNAR